jgi:hypothetical protein
MRRQQVGHQFRRAVVQQIDQLVVEAFGEGVEMGLDIGRRRARHRGVGQDLQHVGGNGIGRGLGHDPRAHRAGGVQMAEHPEHRESFLGEGQGVVAMRRQRLLDPSIDHRREGRAPGRGSGPAFSRRGSSLAAPSKAATLSAKAPLM